MRAARQSEAALNPPASFDDKTPATAKVATLPIAKATLAAGRLLPNVQSEQPCQSGEAQSISAASCLKRQAQEEAGSPKKRGMTKKADFSNMEAVEQPAGNTLGDVFVASATEVHPASLAQAACHADVSDKALATSTAVSARDSKTPTLAKARSTLPMTKAALAARRSSAQAPKKPPHIVDETQSPSPSSLSRQGGDEARCPKQAQKEETQSVGEAEPLRSDTSRELFVASETEVFAPAPEPAAHQSTVSDKIAAESLAEAVPDGKAGALPIAKASLAAGRLRPKLISEQQCPTDEPQPSSSSSAPVHKSVPPEVADPRIDMMKDKEKLHVKTSQPPGAAKRDSKPSAAKAKDSLMSLVCSARQSDASCQTSGGKATTVPEVATLPVAKATLAAGRLLPKSTGKLPGAADEVQPSSPSSSSVLPRQASNQPFRPKSDDSATGSDVPHIKAPQPTGVANHDDRSSPSEARRPSPQQHEVTKAERLSTGLVQQAGSDSTCAFFVASETEVYAPSPVSVGRLSDVSSKIPVAALTEFPQDGKVPEVAKVGALPSAKLSLVERLRLRQTSEPQCFADKPQPSSPSSAPVHKGVLQEVADPKKIDVMKDPERPHAKASHTAGVARSNGRPSASGSKDSLLSLVSSARHSGASCQTRDGKAVMAPQGVALPVAKATLAAGRQHPKPVDELRDPTDEPQSSSSSMPPPKAAPNQHPSPGSDKSSPSGAESSVFSLVRSPWHVDVAFQTRDVDAVKLGNVGKLPLAKATLAAGRLPARSTTITSPPRCGEDEEQSPSLASLKRHADNEVGSPKKKGVAREVGRLVEEEGQVERSVQSDRKLLASAAEDSLLSLVQAARQNDVACTTPATAASAEAQFAALPVAKATLAAGRLPSKLLFETRSSVDVQSAPAESLQSQPPKEPGDSQKEKPEEAEDADMLSQEVEWPEGSARCDGCQRITDGCEVYGMSDALLCPSCTKMKSPATWALARECMKLL